MDPIRFRDFMLVRAMLALVKLPCRALVALWVECEHNAWLPYAVVLVLLIVVNFPE